MEVSHLQFVDDTIFVGEASWDNVRFIKHFLVNLEMVSGLKVNRDKCNIYGLNVANSQMSDFASWLGCTIGSTPFKYLGVRVGSTHRLVVDWEDVVKKIRNRVRKWEGLNLSIGGRLTKEAYLKITELSQGGAQEEKEAFKLIWSNSIPTKVRTSSRLENHLGMHPHNEQFD